MKETVDKTMNAMTLEEKVGQLFFVRVPEVNQIEDITTYHLGGYVLFGRDMENGRKRASRSEAGDHKLSRGQQNANVYWVR